MASFGTIYSYPNNPRVLKVFPYYSTVLCTLHAY